MTLTGVGMRPEYTDHYDALKREITYRLYQMGYKIDNNNANVPLMVFWTALEGPFASYYYKVKDEHLTD